jgi:hypothetical protein
MMTQSLLAYQYQLDKSNRKLTSFGGLPLYLDMAIKSGLCAKITQSLSTKTQGWSDLQIVLSLILLNIAGGDCIDDIERLHQDHGLSTLLHSVDTQGMSPKETKAYKQRWRKTKERAFPSASALRRYLEQFHHAEEEPKRREGAAFIPVNNTLLETLAGLSTTLIDFLQSQSPSEVATIDQDATLSATNKKSALYCYKKFKSYQPFNTYWSEQDMLLGSEFRDGNVPAGYEQLRVFKNALTRLPTSVKTVFLRADSAAYQHDLLEYCAEGQNARFGVIEFAISARVSDGFKKAAAELSDEQWEPIIKKGPKNTEIETDQEWAEVCFVTNWASHKKSNPDYRYIAVREKMVVQQELPLGDLPLVEVDYPFPTVEMNKGKYKLFSIVTNRKIGGNELINWHRERCGASEKVHAVQKSELAGGQFPSQLFGANAAWWQIMVLAYNLNSLMKKLVLPEKLKTKSLKGLRFHLINLPGLIVRHARGLFIKLGGGKDLFDRVNEIRNLIFALGHGPPPLLSQ